MSAQPPLRVRLRRRRLLRTLVVCVLLVLLGAGLWWWAATDRPESASPGESASADDDADAGESAATTSGSPAPDGSSPDGSGASGSPTAESSEPADEEPVSRASRDPDSLHVLVNRRNPLEPADHVPEDLQGLDVEMVYAGQQMRAEPAEALEELFADAREQGHRLKVTTAYRDYGHQKALYDRRLEASGRAVADEYTARPGHSEHQTGLAVDVTSDTDCTLRDCFGDTPEGEWVAEHAHEHGFIIRYPEDAAEITGYAYEPWHLRYVGEETAAAVAEAGITLEEYWGEPPAPEYPDTDEDTDEESGTGDGRADGSGG